MTESQLVAAGHGDPVDAMISAAVRGLIAQRRDAPVEVATAVGISRSAFFYKLGCERPWKAHEVERLAHFFGVSRDSLYEGRSEYRANPGHIKQGSGRDTHRSVPVPVAA